MASYIYCRQVDEHSLTGVRKQIVKVLKPYSGRMYLDDDVYLVLFVSLDVRSISNIPLLSLLTLSASIDKTGAF